MNIRRVYKIVGKFLICLKIFGKSFKYQALLTKPKEAE